LSTVAQIGQPVSAEFRGGGFGHPRPANRRQAEIFRISKQSLPFRSDIHPGVADAVVYLLSPLSRFITGQELHVNGGMYMG
jgi:NAD(P)-dependent dehydrogenase (short-subunit alcohol dehydrogenase family)